MNPVIQIKHFTISDIINSIGEGWNLFLAMPGVSIAYSSIFAAIGLILLGGIGIMGITPMALPFAGGFMLVGPILLSGFFKIADGHNDNNSSVALADAIFALKHAPPQLWIISLICTMLFLVWITDAATLYAMMIGDSHIPYVFPWEIEWGGKVITFQFWGSIMGAVLAFLIFSISAFSVPLLYQHRANLVGAVSLSIKAVFGNFISSFFWALLLSTITIISILLLPLFIVTLPVLAFASYSLHKKILPLPENTSDK